MIVKEEQLIFPARGRKCKYDFVVHPGIKKFRRMIWLFPCAAIDVSINISIPKG